MNEIVFLDFDDFSEQNNRLDWLWMLKNEFSNFKVNLFASFSLSSNGFFYYINNIKWINLCFHGSKHLNNEEVTKKELETARLDYSFSKVYRAPYWQLSDKMYKRLKRLGYKIMLHPNDSREGIKFNWNIKDSPPPLKILYAHGHIQNYPSGPKGNGLVQAMENILKLPKDTNFRFL